MNLRRRLETKEREVKRLKEHLDATKAAAETNVSKRREAAKRRIELLEAKLAIAQTELAHLKLEVAKREKKATSEVEAAQHLLEAAVETAKVRCAKIGVQYRDGETTLETVQEVVKPKPEEAAQKVDPPLRFGIGLHSTVWLDVLGWLLIVPSFILMATNFGLIWGGVVLVGGGKVHFHFAPLTAAIAAGLILSIGIPVSLRKLWHIVGMREATGKGLGKTFWAAILLVAIVILCGTVIDANVIFTLAQGDSDLVISWTTCIVMGGLLTAIYALSAVFSAFNSGYRPVALRRAEGYRDEYWKGKLRDDANIAATIQALAGVDQAKAEVLKAEERKRKVLAENKECLDEAEGKIKSMEDNMDKERLGCPTPGSEDFTPTEHAEINLIQKDIDIAQGEIDALFAALLDEENRGGDAA